MAESNSVFISYRREISGYPALAVYQYLNAHSIDAFMDYKSIPAGKFEPVILDEIAARPYFIIILAPGCLKRCKEPGDWLRREIEYAMKLERKIIPLLTSNFDFKARYARPYLTGELAKLPSYQAQKAPLEFFETAMEQLCTGFLTPTDLPSIKPTYASDFSSAEREGRRRAAQSVLNRLALEPLVTQQQLVAQEHFEHGLALFDEKELDEAINAFTEAIRLGLQSYEVYSCRGLVYFMKGKLDDADKDLSEAIRLNPQDGRLYNFRGLTYSGMHELDKAIVDLSEAIRLDPQNASFYGDRGYAYREKEQLDVAVADWTEAIRLDPQNAIFYIDRGETYFALYHYQSALEDFKRACELSSEYDAAVAGLAIAHYALGQVKKAKREWLSLVAKDERYMDIFWVGREFHTAFPLAKKADELIRRWLFRGFREVG